MIGWSFVFFHSLILLNLPNDSRNQHKNLIDDENQVDIIITLSDTSLSLDQKGLVGKCGWTPTTTLFEKLVEFFRAVCGVRSRSTIIQTPSTFNHKSTKPTIFTCSDRFADLAAAMAPRAIESLAQRMAVTSGCSLSIEDAIVFALVISHSAD